MSGDSEDLLSAHMQKQTATASQTSCLAHNPADSSCGLGNPFRQSPDSIAESISLACGNPSVVTHSLQGGCIASHEGYPRIAPGPDIVDHNSDVGIGLDNEKSIASAASAVHCQEQVWATSTLCDPMKAVTTDNLSHDVSVGVGDHTVQHTSNDKSVVAGRAVNGRSIAHCELSGDTSIRTRGTEC